MISKKLAIKIQWLKNWIRENNCEALDVLNTKLVDDYAEEFKVKRKITMYGANKCKSFGVILSKLYHLGVLQRGIISLPEMCSGFPRWLYSYSFKEENNK